MSGKSGRKGTARSRLISAAQAPGPLSYWRDPAFWLALLFGPICWFLMFWFGVPVRAASEPPWRALLWIAVIYPVLEEYVFRGGLQAALYRNTRMSLSWLGLSLANIATSIVFAAMHLINQPPIWAMLVFFPSLVFGWMRDRYDRFHASIALHVVYNAGFVWFFSA